MELNAAFLGNHLHYYPDMNLRTHLQKSNETLITWKEKLSKMIL